MTAAHRNEASASEQTAFFFPPSLESVKKQGKKLRKLLGKDVSHLSNAYDLSARIFGYQSYQAIRQAYLSNELRATIWDHELSESQLRERWRVQAQVLVTNMQISEVDALEILDAGRFSARNANVVDEQSLPAGFVPRSGGRLSVDDSESRVPTLEAELGDLGDAAAGTQINQVKVVYRKRRLLQKAL